MQQAEHITESEVDIEKKKQELYSEIDALGIKSDSRINKLKKFLADRKIWHLEEMDYPLRNSYEQYLRGQIRSQIVSFYLKIYDTVKQQHIYQQMQTLNGKRIYEWKYQNKKYLAIHGHQFDNFLVDNAVISFLANWIYNFIQIVDFRDF